MQIRIQQISHSQIIVMTSLTINTTGTTSWRTSYFFTIDVNNIKHFFQRSTRGSQITK